jgi:hypothetical protein
MIKQPSFLSKLRNLGQDPQAWISMLALVTLLGLGSGLLESADRPTQAQIHSGAVPDEQLASVDASKL